MRLEPDEKAYEDAPAKVQQPRTSVYLPLAIQQDAREFAKRRGITLSRLVALALKEYMKAHG